MKKTIIVCAAMIVIIFGLWVATIQAGAKISNWENDIEKNNQRIEDIEITQDYLHLIANRFRNEPLEDLNFVSVLGNKWTELNIHKQELHNRNGELKNKIETFQKGYLGKFELTAYCITGRTASGTHTTANRTIAVDPKVIPYGKKVYIEGYGTYVAEDCGGAVKGNIIDIYIPGYQNCINFGRRKANVYLLE